MPAKKFVAKLAPDAIEHTFKRAQRGLFAGEHIRFGDQVSEHGNRTRRTFVPNIQKVSLWSETLKERLRLSVSTKALELIDKAGGLDAYLLGQRLPESQLAAKLRERILLKRLELEQRKTANAGLNCKRLFNAG